LAWTRRALELSPNDQWHSHNLTSFEEQLGHSPVDPLPAFTP
jgi:hypothetical protein